MSIVRTRIFTGDENPAIRFREFVRWVDVMTIPPDVSGRVPIYTTSNTILLTPSSRVTTVNKEEVSSKFELKGTQTTWVKHIHLSGSLSWEKIDWPTAQALIKAFQFEWTGDPEEDPTADACYLKIFSDDPYNIPIKISSDLSFPFLASKLVGHSCTINWESTKPLDSRGLELVNFWLANYPVSNLYWS